MRRTTGLTLALSAFLALPAVTQAQGAMEASRNVAGGGISVPGWLGKIDAREEKSGMSLNSARLAKEGTALHATTGPAVTYWNPANKASGNYTVMATFKEPQYMNLNDHPHPYGVVIAGNDLGTDKASYLYCGANGNGSFIVRGFGEGEKGSTAFQMNGGRGEVNAAVNKASAKGAPVTNEVAVSVNGDKVTCAINGKTVATYEKSALVTKGKLASTDGLYGLRFAHNTDVVVTGLMMMKGK
jgi:hypothetical protein